MTRKEEVNDLTNEFDARLQAMRRSRRVPQNEMDAHISVYERVRSARAICKSLLPGFKPADVVAVAGLIAGAAQSGQFVTSRE